MLDILKLVERAAADTDIVKILKHICVYDGRLQSGDSRVTIDAKCDELKGHSFTAPADKLVKAVLACKGETPKIVRQDDGTVRVTHKKFRISLPSMDVSLYPLTTKINESSVQLDIPADFINKLKKVAPFINDNPVQGRWATGVCIMEGYLYATNNITIVRTPIEWTGPKLNIPDFAIKQLSAIDLPITGLWCDKTSITFEFDDCWLKSQLLTYEWPDKCKTMFSNTSYKPVPDGLLQEIESLIPFCPDVKFPTIHFKEGLISTSDGMQSAEIDFEGAEKGVFRADVLQAALGIAKEWNMPEASKPVYFKGDDIEGLFVGVRV